MTSTAVAHRSNSHLLLLLIIVIFSLLLRCFSLSALGYWTDELCTLSCAQGWGLAFDKPPLNHVILPQPALTQLANAKPLSAVFPGLIRDEAHPPLYFVLLRLWEDLFGDSESAVRSVDVGFSVVAIVLLFCAARDSIGSAASLWACLLMAVAEPQIQFAQEARNYMPVVTFSLTAMCSLQQLSRKPGYLAASTLTMSLLAMMLTHYFAAGVGVALGLHVMISMRGAALRLALQAFAAAALLFLLLWGRPLYEQLPHFRSNYAWVGDAAPGHVGRTLTQLLNIPYRLIAELPESFTLRWIASSCGFVFYGLLLVNYVQRPVLRVWILWAGCSIGLVLGVDLVRSTAQLALLRYTLFASPAVYVLIAAAVPRGRWMVPALCIGLALLSLPSAYNPGWKTDFHSPIRIIANTLQPTDALVIIGPDPVSDGVMYAAFQHYLPTMPGTMAVLTRPPDGSTLAQLQNCSRIWTVRTWPVAPIDLPGFEPLTSQSIPYFAVFAQGRFVHGNLPVRPATKPN